MKVNGLLVDEKAIAEGVYGIICDKGEEAIVAFGMIPQWSMDMLERLLREKVIALSAAQIQVTPEEFQASGLIDETLLKETVRPIVMAIATGIYGAAARAGRMVV